jgi:hypothetical protein
VTNECVGADAGENKRDDMGWDEMGRFAMIVRIACAIFSFFSTVGIIGILGGRIAFYLHFREHYI